LELLITNLMNIGKFIFVTAKELRQFIKFCIVGVIAALIHFLVMYLMTEKFAFWYVYSALSGGIISAIWNFLANKFWTFKNLAFGYQAVSQAVKFFVVICLGVGLNTVIIFMFTDFLNFDYRLSWVFATGIVLFWNFGFNKFWTFRLNSEISL